jgi:pyridoxamine 5'-phosphate oxidase
MCKEVIFLTDSGYLTDKTSVKVSSLLTLRPYFCHKKYMPDLTNIADLRRSYSLKQLSVEDVLPHPIDQFRIWFEEALQGRLLEANAMALATADASGKPSARIVLLKGFDEGGFVFFTNYESAKGREIESNPRVSLLFFWVELERQVRIEGVAEKVSADYSREYFQSRPKDSQIGAWTSPQSRVIESREILEQKMRDLTEEFKHDEVLPLPDHWGGYLVRPHEMEFWQGRVSRLHDRIRYRHADGTWIIERLAP